MSQLEQAKPVTAVAGTQMSGYVISFSVAKLMQYVPHSHVQ